MLPYVCDFLRNHTLSELEDTHGVVARPNKSYDKLSLNYDQILTKSGDVVAEQCRGLIVRPKQKLDEASFKSRIIGDVNVLAWPMNRFYNHGDSNAANINWNDSGLRVYEKLDGTMIVCYWDDEHGRWHAATRGVPEADLPIRAGHMEIGDMTFSELFFHAFKLTRESMSEWIPGEFYQLDKELTYVFELTSPYNRVVVKYGEPRVTLLAARHTATGVEHHIDSIDLPHVHRPKSWSIKSPSAIEAFVNSADPALLEGAVVCDSSFQRIKVKNKAWVLSSRAKDLVTVSRRGAIESIIAGTIDDVIPLVEEDIANELRSMQDSLRDYICRVDLNFKTWNEEASGNRKRFAELVNLSNDWVTPYFQLYDKKSSTAHEWFVSTQAAGKLTPRMLDVILQKIKRDT